MTPTKLGALKRSLRSASDAQLRDVVNYVGELQGGRRKAELLRVAEARHELLKGLTRGAVIITRGPWGGKPVHRAYSMWKYQPVKRVAWVLEGKRDCFAPEAYSLTVALPTLLEVIAVLTGNDLADSFTAIQLGLDPITFLRVPATSS